jgi:hypothetical protein
MPPRGSRAAIAASGDHPDTVSVRHNPMPLAGPSFRARPLCLSQISVPRTHGPICLVAPPAAPAGSAPLQHTFCPPIPPPRASACAARVRHSRARTAVRAGRPARCWPRRRAVPRASSTSRGPRGAGRPPLLPPPPPSLLRPAPAPCPRPLARSAPPACFHPRPRCRPRA